MSQIEFEKLIPVDLVIESRFIATVNTNNDMFNHYAVVVNDGKILDMLPTEDARKKYLANECIVLDNHVLMPGLINLHTHAAMSLMRGLADDVALMPWLNQHIWPAEQAVVSSSYVKDATTLACAEMLSGGITCFNDMYFYPESAALAASQTGVRAQLGLVVLDFATQYAADPEDYLQKGFSTRDNWRDHALISFSIAPHAPYTVSNNTFEKVVTYAEQLSIGIHTHLHETRDEVLKSEADFGIRPIQRMRDLGVLGPNLVAAHCVHLDESEIDLLTEYGCHIAHCPTSNLKLGSGIAPINKILKAQINIGLGTDGVASNNRLDMFSEMRLAALLAKGVNEDATLLSAKQVLRMATINGAKALGLDTNIGSIEINKYADMMAVRLCDMSTEPCYDPISHLVYACGREQVSHTWVAGELRYANGVYANIEPNELKAIIRRWQPKVGIYKK
jgi:5-methylthioadenosine/S-adenosylhomocysteine deaminase